MAVITVNALVLGGRLVAASDKANWVRLGSLNQGHRQTPATPFSMRHPTHGYPVQQEPEKQRAGNVDTNDGACTRRAGRLASQVVGVSLRGRRVSGTFTGITTKPCPKWFSPSKRTQAKLISKRRICGLRAAL
jgi:hypothetical protein